MYFCQMLQTVASFLLVFVGLYLLRSLRHHRPFAVFNNVYSHAALDIVLFAVSTNIIRSVNIICLVELFRYAIQ